MKKYEVIWGSWSWRTTATSAMGALSKAAAVYTYKVRRLNRDYVSETVRAFKKRANVLDLAECKRKKKKNPQQLELKL